MAVIEFKKADEMEARFIATHVREADYLELADGTLTHPYDAMIRAINDDPERSVTAYINGIPVCMFGVTPAGICLSSGIPWMIGTHFIDKTPKSFLRKCRDVVCKISNNFDYLVNYVDARNTRAVEWLKWLGFTINEAEPYGPKGLLFHKFWMTQEVKNV